jgi:hypothetical protein
MRNPDYASFFTKDVYVEPVSVEAPQEAKNEKMLHLKKGASQDIGGGTTVTFKKFEMQSHATENMTSGGAMGIGVVLDVTKGKSTRTVTVLSSFDQGVVAEATPLELDPHTVVRFLGMNIGMTGEGSTVILSVTDPSMPVQPPTSELLVVEASIKPLISCVWVGSFLALLGAGIAIVRRRREMGGATRPKVAMVEVRDAAEVANGG